MFSVSDENIFNADTEALVNTVNCVGIMGKGLALQFKKLFPSNFKAYQKACKQGKVQPGHIFVFATEEFTNPKYIFNFPTKRHWKENSQLEDIRLGLRDLIRKIKELNIKSITIPPLGCGNGRLEWPSVLELIQEACKELVGVQIKVIRPKEYNPEVEIQKNKPRITRSRALLIKLMGIYKELDYSLSLLEIQKLAYFLQESGEPLKLRFEQAHYGPFAHNLNKVLALMEGHYIRGFDPHNPKPNKEIELINDVAEEANTLLNQDVEALNRLKTVESLIEGFESPYGLELLATIHWTVHHTTPAISTLPETIKYIHKWNEKKKSKFSSEHITTTWEHLKNKKWI